MKAVSKTSKQTLQVVFRFFEATFARGVGIKHENIEIQTGNRQMYYEIFHAGLSARF